MARDVTGDDSAVFCSTAAVLVPRTGSLLQRRLPLPDTGAQEYETTSNELTCDLAVLCSSSIGLYERLGPF